MSVEQLLANGGTEMNERFKRCSKMSHEELLRETLKLMNENRRLKNRLNDHEPFKQKALKPPNQ